MSRITRTLVLALALAGAAAHAQEAGSPNLAPGFSARSAQSKLLVVPAEMELYSISAGGITEPRADWTDAAQQHFQAALKARGEQLGPEVQPLTEAQLDEFAPIIALHRNVAECVFYHHLGSGPKLPTKDGKLDWSLGEEAVRPLRERTGADYALFTWLHDSYASSERKATMVAMALLGAITLGGEQVGYASLVDLRTGRVVWFNKLQRMSGDLREPTPAAETVEALLKGFPPRR
jgi:hypothetical protein